jgi:hypothetical protein
MTPLKIYISFNQTITSKSRAISRRARGERGDILRPQRSLREIFSYKAQGKKRLPL